MSELVAEHYVAAGDLVARISEALRAAGKDLAALEPADLAAIDQFHIRGRAATLELGERMRLTGDSEALDIGSGLGGPARTLAESFGCHVTGIDLTAAFCEAATALASWVGLGARVEFRQGDATALPFLDASFDAAMTIHTAMNIAAKDRHYAEARRVLRPGSIFSAYDVLQGEGGPVHFPVPWAREPSISHLATTERMRELLDGAGFEILAVEDSTEASQNWFEKRLATMRAAGPPALSFALFLGEDFGEMVRNQVRNLQERRIRTVSFYCQA